MGAIADIIASSFGCNREAAETVEAKILALGIVKMERVIVTKNVMEVTPDDKE